MSRFRTLLAGFGVLVVCIAVASLKSQYFLFSLAGASVFFSLWSWYKQSGLPQPSKNVHRLSQKLSTHSNVYTLPVPGAQTSDATGT